MQERAALGAEGDLAKVQDVRFELDFAKKYVQLEWRERECVRRVKGGE